MENRKREEMTQSLVVQNHIKQLMQKIKSIANRFFNSIGFPITIGILLLLKCYFFYQNTIVIREQDLEETMRGSVIWIAAFMMFLMVLPKRTRTRGTIILNILMSILLWADHVYYSYASNVLSVAQITNLQYGEEILSTLPILLEPIQLVYFLDSILILLLQATKILKIEENQEKTRTTTKQKIIPILGKVALIVVSFILLSTKGVKMVERGREDPYNKDTQIKKATIIGYHVFDIENTINIKKQAKYSKKEEMLKDYKTLKENYQEKYGETNYSFEGISKDDNVIILQLESIQDFVVNRKIGGKEITPNLNKFLKENVRFTNMHMQSYSSTADSEHSTVNSMYPAENGMSYSKYYTNTYNDIFSMFHEAGYETMYIHGNYAQFWNRGNVYSRLPIDDLHFKEQFEDTSEHISGYLSDEVVYQESINQLKKKQNPNFSYIVAASSHTPFTMEGLEDRSKIDIDVGKYEGTFFGNYLEAVNYADYAFGTFISSLKQEGLYDNTTILVFGDHNGLTMYDEEMMEFLKLDSEQNDIDCKLNYTKVAAGMKLPGVRNLKIQKPVNKLDIKPSMSYLCDLEDGISLGTNFFARKDYVSLNNERIITSRYYFDGDWYEIKTGNLLNQDELQKEEKELLEDYYQNMRAELDISLSISINDLLK